MIRILSENKESEIEVSGDVNEVANEILNIIPSLILDFAEQAADGDKAKKQGVAIGLLATSAGILIHNLIGGELEQHVVAMTKSIDGYIMLAESQDEIKKLLISALIGKDEQAEPAPEETAETEAEKE